jgi:acetyl/propionyl-CoA carboxylase alpha subunit
MLRSLCHDHAVVCLLLLLQPDSGRLEAYRPPGGPGIRLDSAVTAGNVVSRYYDSLLSKVISSAPTFDKAVQRMPRALQEFQVRAEAWAGAGVEVVLVAWYLSNACSSTSLHLSNMCGRNSSYQVAKHQTAV